MFSSVIKKSLIGKQPILFFCVYLLKSVKKGKKSENCDKKFGKYNFDLQLFVFFFEKIKKTFGDSKNNFLICYTKSKIKTN